MSPRTPPRPATKRPILLPRLPHQRRTRPARAQSPRSMQLAPPTPPKASRPASTTPGSRTSRGARSRNGLTSYELRRGGWGRPILLCIM
ncbi:hypothetical protein B0T18DRAFT_251258 [Schizothecium vesticola]|uniref:Uncharacterized protein n=1 Tax=Schizothecium vesticola TaxID=314040 RepID=A0AA40BQS7_9PEZI|nr:hypothetical protein B0T18DRAFT_251258 [Schizothecium vesticola]